MELMSTHPTPAPKWVRHFSSLREEQLDRLFLQPPIHCAHRAEKNLIAMMLGATLYMPATRDDLAADVITQGLRDATSVVFDLEDAVSDDDVDSGLANIVAALNKLGNTPVHPLVFVRVRTNEQIVEIVEKLTPEGISALSGFALPKFGSQSREALETVKKLSSQLEQQLWVMPILESASAVFLETRKAELAKIRELLNEFRESVLIVRIGATDICGQFGIRRDPDLTIYDVHIAASAIAYFVNVLGRQDGTGFPISGPVWEYFSSHERMFRPLLRQTPFEEIDAVRFRQHLVSRDLDGLLREVVLDRANGLQGKTVIHPSHVKVINTMNAATHEEYQDALDVLGLTAGGAHASTYRNKMNEVKPHRNWAVRTLTRAEVFGVLRPEFGFVDLLTAVVDQ